MSNVKTLAYAFQGAVAFRGTGAEAWNLGAVTNLFGAFSDTTWFDAGVVDVLTGGHSWCARGQHVLPMSGGCWDEGSPPGVVE